MCTPTFWLWWTGTPKILECCNIVLQ
jgi:hypothetical protein